MRKENPLDGHTVVAVYLAKDKGAIRFDVADGEPIVARADGDCCSKTWIEHVEGAEVLVGAVVRAVEDLDMPNLGTPAGSWDVVAYYGCKIVGDKGEVVIDYRNESNGYYGGSLVWPGENFYGGVYHQNVSADEWERLA